MHNLGRHQRAVHGTLMLVMSAAHGHAPDHTLPLPVPSALLFTSCITLYNLWELLPQPGDGCCSTSQPIASSPAVPFPLSGDRQRTCGLLSRGASGRVRLPGAAQQTLQLQRPAAVDGQARPLGGHAGHQGGGAHARPGALGRQGLPVRSNAQTGGQIVRGGASSGEVHACG